MTSIRLVEIVQDEYICVEGFTIKRMPWGETPNGNPFAGRWVLHDAQGVYIDHDQYRTDLMERNGFNSTTFTIAQFLEKEFA